MTTLEEKFIALAYVERTILSTKDLPFQGVNIVSARLTNTPYGTVIKLETDDNVIFLPKRYSQLSKHGIWEWGNGNYRIVKDSLPEKPVSL